MATGSPAELKKQGEELKVTFSKIKKKQHNIAILMGKEGLVIETHLKKSPEVCLKAAKKAGGMPKGVWGTATMEGQIIIVDPINEKIPGNLTKLAKKHFSERGMKFKLEIKEPDEETTAKSGEEEEEELQLASGGDEEEEELQLAADREEEEEGLQMATGDEEEEEIMMSSGREEEEEPIQAKGSDQNEEGQTKTAPAEDPKKRLEDQLAKMQDQIDELQADTENVMHSELVDALRGHERVMEEGNFDRAVETLRRIEVALEDYASIQAIKLPLQQRFDDMAKDMDRILSGDNAAAKEQIETAKRGFEYALPKRDWDDSKRFLDNIEKAISEAGGVQTPEKETAEEPPTDQQNDREETQAKTDEPATPKLDDAPDEEAENPQLVELRDRYTQVSDEIDALMADKENIMHDQLVEAVRSYESQIAEERFDRGFDSMARIESILKDYEGLLAKCRPLQARMDKMQAAVERVKSGDDETVAREIDEQERGYLRGIRLREWDDASLHLDNMERLLDAHKEDGTEESGQERAVDDPDQQDTTTSQQTPPETPTAEATDAKENTADKADLVKRFSKTKDAFGQLLKSGKTMSGVDPRELAQDFGKHMKSEEFDSAEVKLSEIENLVKEAGNTPEKANRMAQMAEMKKRLDSLLKELN